ncbi:MAG: F0F1 ATP synthase subunit A [Anaerolineae bacterium]
MRKGVTILVVAGAVLLLCRLSQVVPVVLPAIQLPAEKLPIGILGFQFTNTLIATWLAMLILIALSIAATRKMEIVPSGVQNLMEMIVERFYELVEQTVGERARQFFPLIMTIFLLVLVANWMELIPGVDSIGPLAHPHGEEAKGYVVKWIGGIGLLTAEEAEHGKGYIVVPFVRAAATDLNFTLALALIAQFTVQAVGLRTLGLGYVRKFFNLKGIESAVGVLEFVSEIAKVISFSFRLFGNIFAGQVLLFVIAFLIPYVFPAIFYGLEIFVGFVQALVFAMLTMVFLHMATLHHEEGH